MKRYSFFIKQIKYDLFIFLREPFFALPIMLLPAIFFYIYTRMYANSADVMTFGQYIPAYALLISFLTIFFNIGIQIVTDKELGVYKRIMISPANLYFMVATYVVRGVLISFVGLTEIILLAKIGFGIPLTENLLAFIFTFLILIGVMLLFSLSLHGFFKNSKQVLPFTIIMFQYVLFASGMLAPVHSLPKFMRVLVYINPIYHMNRIAVSVWEKTNVGGINVLALLIVCFICSIFVVIQRRKEI